MAGLTGFSLSHDDVASFHQGTQLDKFVIRLLVIALQQALFDSQLDQKGLPLVSASILTAIPR